ncbi:hypothetical protein BS47DRAFT_1346994 [Hydnum rufescens UP504]|uniref:Uncharacterized protein n=1 Tax=Hydnum rufescens UP504 TaxID=1448309 RepID=A0A9P6DRN0_9AGAM|nr:hypothetical protein BS47DRAFT_1346994 [Hydnum rufescens UP504]
MTLAIAFFATISGFGILLTYRLFVHVSDATTDGTQAAVERWWNESMTRLGPPRSIPSFRAYVTAERKSAGLK